MLIGPAQGYNKDWDFEMKVESQQAAVDRNKRRKNKIMYINLLLSFILLYSLISR